MIIGHSVEGRPIVASGSGPLLLFGAIHGDEPHSAELCERFLSLEPAAVVVPVVNPDGLARASKDNARGVDLNRNFLARNWSAAHSPGYFPGERPLSEPESAALAQLIDQLKPRAIVSVHQPFRCVNWDGPAADLAAQMAKECGYPARASIGYPTPGSFGSAYGVDRGLPVITLELPGREPPVADDDFAACLRALERAMLWVACLPPR